MVGGLGACCRKSGSVRLICLYPSFLLFSHGPHSKTISTLRTITVEYLYRTLQYFGREPCAIYQHRRFEARFEFLCFVVALLSCCSSATACIVLCWYLYMFTAVVTDGQLRNTRAMRRALSQGFPIASIEDDTYVCSTILCMYRQTPFVLYAYFTTPSSG